MKITKYIAALFVIIAATSCEKEIDFEYHEVSPMVVIESTIDQNGSKVSLTYTTPMGEPMDTLKITDAIVTITDIGYDKEYILKVNSNGEFYCDSPGIEGREYMMKVTLGGQSYVAKSRMLPYSELRDVEFKWIRMPGDDMAALRIVFEDNPASIDYYWVRIYRNGKAYTWSVITDKAQIDGFVEETITTTHRDESLEDEKSLLKDGDIIKVTLTPINKRMFDHLTALANGYNGFSMIEGENCLGFFIASPTAEKTITFHPEEIDYAN